MGRRTQRIPSWPGATVPTKAAYICADQPVTFTFRLQQGGGPYIPDGRPNAPHSPFIFDEGVQRAMRLDPNKIAVDYYFGDLQYWKLPRIAANALEEGYDGPALRKLAGLANPVESDFRSDEIDSAFRELGVDAPISKDMARMALAVESAHRVLDGGSNVFDEATHIRIHLCGFADPPIALKRVVDLSNEAGNAPRSLWSRIEAHLRGAFADLLMRQQTQPSESPAIRK